MRSISRRDFVQAPALALGLAGCACRRAANRQPAGETPVSVVRAQDYGQRLYGEVRRLIGAHGLKVKGKRVLLKPNLVEFEPDSCINTHPLLVHAVLEAFRAMGAQVAIGEGPGHRRNTLDLADAAGYFQTIPGFENLFIDLNLDEVAHIRLNQPHSRLGSVYVARSAMACDLLVSIPKMKTHHWAGATLSMKNLFGTVSGGVYGWPKNVLHWAGIPECIADLHRALPAHFAIVDGIVGMQGNGPIQGKAKRAGVLVAGRDLRAVDSTCCQIMSIDPDRIAYLRLALADAGGDAPAIRQIGESVESVRTRFELIPEWNRIRLG